MNDEEFDKLASYAIGQQKIRVWLYFITVMAIVGVIWALK